VTPLPGAILLVLKFTAVKNLATSSAKLGIMNYSSIEIIVQICAFSVFSKKYEVHIV